MSAWWLACPYCPCDADEHNRPDLGGDCLTCGDCPGFPDTEAEG